MTPSEKAYELVLKFQFKQEGIRKELAKRCALIAVHEMMRIAPWGGDIDSQIEDGSKEFYMNVKKEIEKL